MSRYIDADAYAAEMKTRQDACKEILDAAKEDGNDDVYDRMNCAFGIFVEAKLTLDSMPTVDAVPVVRCRECKHRKQPTDYCEKLLKAYVPDDFYCFYGKRKENEDGAN